MYHLLLDCIHQRSSHFLFSMQYRVIMLSASRAHTCVLVYMCLCASQRLAELMNHPCRSKGNPYLLSMQPCLLSASSTAPADIKRLCWLTLKPATCTLACICAHTPTQTLGVVFQRWVQISSVGNVVQLQWAAREKTKVKKKNFSVCPSLPPCFTLVLAGRSGLVAVCCFMHSSPYIDT